MQTTDATTPAGTTRRHSAGDTDGSGWIVADVRSPAVTAARRARRPGVYYN